MIDSVEVVIRQPGFPDRVVPLSRGRTQMGRGDDNEIVLSDVGVSRRHAQIVVSETEVSVEDLGSGNGTYYFGHRVTSQPLRDQDEVVIDPFVLHFRIQGSGIAAVADPATVPSEVEGPRIEVVVGNGMAGSLFPINEHGLTMGRAEDRDIVVPDPASSRHHCHITLEQGEYVLHDNGSANGVFVNAVRVRECTLSSGDLVRIGNTEMRFVNPAEQVQDMLAAAAVDPIGSMHEPAIDFPIDPHPQHAAAAPTGGGIGRLIAAVAGLLLMFVVGSLVVVVVVLAVLLIVVQSGAAPAGLPAQSPVWALDGAAPVGDIKKLNEDGMLASQAGDHSKALEQYLQVLKKDPGNNTAAKFAAFSGTHMVLADLEAQMVRAASERATREKRRTLLLKQVRKRRLRDKTRAKLEREFREDFVVQEAMSWSVTPKQNKHRKELDKARDQVELQDRQAEGVKLLRRLLTETTDPETRNKAQQLIAEGVEHQVGLIAPRWREAVLLERGGNKGEAKAIFQRISTADASNVSTAVHLKRLSGK